MTRDFCFKDLVFALCGFILYLAVGAKVAAYTYENSYVLDLADITPAYRSLASMCILTSIVHLVDVVFSAINLKRA